MPAYAVADQGGPIDVQPKERKRRSVSAPAGQEVSPSEFQEMVKDLGIDEATSPAGGRGLGRDWPPHAGGRRARARATG